MKKMVCLIAFYMIILTANAQPPDAGSLFRKSSRQKTTAWILSGGGLGLLTAGFLVGVSTVNDIANLSFPSDKKLAAGGALVVAGGAAILGSIPFFIAAGKNKKKATLLLKNENVFFPQFYSKQRLVSLGVTIHL